MRKTTYLLAAGAMFAANVHAITILDQGFESPDISPKHYLKPLEADTLPGWVIADNGIGEVTWLVDEIKFAGLSPELNFQGSQALVMNEGTTISTTVSLIAGQNYSFDIWGYQGRGEFIHDLQIEIGTFATSLAFEFWKDAGGVQHKSFNFTALDSGDVTLAITNPETGVDFKQRVIDHITITAVPDGGASAILLGLGCLGLFAMRRK